MCCAGCRYAPRGVQCHQEEEGLDSEGSCEEPAYCKYPSVCVCVCVRERERERVTE